MTKATSGSLKKECKMQSEDLVERLRIRAKIRATITSRKSVQEGKEDRLGLLLIEAADRIEKLERDLEDSSMDYQNLLWKVRKIDFDMDSEDQ